MVALNSATYIPAMSPNRILVVSAGVKHPERVGQVVQLLAQYRAETIWQPVYVVKEQPAARVDGTSQNTGQY